MAKTKETEIYYLDDDDEIVEKSKATKVNIRELDGDGNLINETFMLLTKKG